LLVAFDGSPGSFRRPKSQAGDDSLLDESVVLLDDVVEIRRCSAATRADFEDIKRRLCGWRMIDMPPSLPFDVQKKTDSDDP
jgi:hypothetical protein